MIPFAPSAGLSTCDLEKLIWRFPGPAIGATGGHMIKILDKSDEPSNQDLFIQMFRGRAAVFRDRLRWPVAVRNGLEIDDYDREANPTYLIATDGAGTVIGSLRILPTTGPTMLGKEFAGMFPDLWEIRSPVIWECTRFCVHSAASTHRRAMDFRTSSELLISLCEFAKARHIEHIVGVYQQHMSSVYRRIGWSPLPIAASTQGEPTVAGMWAVSSEAIAAMKRRANLVASRLGWAA
jgi:N-acyl-L-homoserine lactone synthetase